MFQGNIDPDLAELLGTVDSSLPSSAVRSAVPDFSSLFEEAEIEAGEETELDLTITSFPEIVKKQEDKVHPAFKDPNWYKTCLSEEGQQAQRLHSLIQKYINAKDPKDKGVYRQQVIVAYWDFLANLSRLTPIKLPDPKRFLLRYAILHPNFIDQEERSFFGKVVVENELSQPIYYLDEWLKAIGTGVIKNSTTDEVGTAKVNEQTRISTLLEKAQGRLDAAKNLMQGKTTELKSYEDALIERVNTIRDHNPIPGLAGVPSNYTDFQRKAFNDIGEISKRLLKLDREMATLREDLELAIKSVESLTGKAEDVGATVSVDVKAIDMEFSTVRQMNKMAVGRRGNHFPILTKEYFRLNPQEVATRENVIEKLRWLESIDPEAFCRSFRNTKNRIVPYIILLPNYGDAGICWEPFDRYNRATSRGRIALPMYPKNLLLAILIAVGDLRWQVAKEKASYYWMEEGLTGYYYQYFQSKKLKGDVKDYFIQDYIVWITKESDGIQKLDKDARGIFWRHVPFSQEIKDRLNTRSYVYQDLYQKDINRSMSDGY